MIFIKILKILKTESNFNNFRIFIIRNKRPNFKIAKSMLAVYDNTSLTSLRTTMQKSNLFELALKNFQP